jgi:GH15 family glucan-1,4-alpha-glucosidase
VFLSEMASRIEDYALIGDTYSAGLVARDGSIDWLCLPRFDSGACFAALLGEPRHGRWKIAPAGEPQTTRRAYRGDTLVLETEMECAEGVVRLIDCMSPRARRPQVIRLVEGVRGRVPMTMELVIRFDYGSIIPWVQRVGEVLTAIGGPDALCLRAPVETQGHGLTTVAEFTVTKGQQIPFVLGWYPSHESCPEPIDAVAVVAQTETWWQQWSAHCTYQGRWRDVVMRSLLTLKALTYAPTGGLVAAPTTSLPEALGGPRNWDYRFCWIRDATLTLYAMMINGFVDEARAWRDWVLRAVAGDPAVLQTLYGCAGERRIEEVDLGWLPGYEGSRPVRIGNAAYRQFQLDVYGELVDCMHLARRSGIESEAAAWALERKVIAHVESCWDRPDQGLWEVRGPRQHFTHSKVMAWVAFDRAVKAVERFGYHGPVEQWRNLRARLHEEICRAAYDPQRNTFTQAYGSAQLDAALLMLPLVGFLPAKDPRMIGTVAAIERTLVRDGLVLRYSTAEVEDGLPPGEGVFLPCSFWLADNYVLQGRREEAAKLFERLLGLCNDVGLLSEEYDPVTRRMVGNFPQAFTHVGVLNTAMNLSKKKGPAKARAQP